jgi:hypothetical protein
MTQPKSRMAKLRKASQAPATLATAKERNAAVFTALAEAKPLATKRIGPTRSASVL